MLHADLTLFVLSILLDIRRCECNCCVYWLLSKGLCFRWPGNRISFDITLHKDICQCLRDLQSILHDNHAINRFYLAFTHI